MNDNEFQKLGKIPFDEYRKIPRLAQSDLVMMAKSPRHFQLRDKLRDETEAMRFGTLFHMAVLEPKRFRENFVIEPVAMPNGEEINKRSSKHRDWLTEWRKDNLDKVIVDETDMGKLTAMLNEMALNPLLAELFSGGDSEVGATWKYRGIECKGRADYFSVETLHGRLLVELKKTQSASHSNFTRSIFNYYYDVQAAWYKEGFQADKHIIVAVEDRPPYGIGIYDTINWAEHGKIRMDRMVDKLLECQVKDEWPSYTGGIELILPPTWISGMAQEEV